MEPEIRPTMYDATCPSCSWQSLVPYRDPLKALERADRHIAATHPRAKPEILSVTAQAIAAAELGYLPGEDGPMAEWLAEYAERRPRG